MNNDPSGRSLGGLKRLALMLAGLVTVATVFVATRSPGKGEVQLVPRNQSYVPTRQEEQDRGSAEKIASAYIVKNFTPSLEMKEKADFLLTPALLMQEVVSDGTVLTYPEE
jgi:hypothetical protein